MPKLLLGRDIDNKEKVYIQENVRSTHMQVIGSTGTGKSKFLQWMIQKDILNNNGLCLIDPHGYLYEDVLNFLASHEDFFSDRKIVLFNPASDDYFLGFNPFIHHSHDISHQVDTMVNACAKAWGAESMDATPLLKKCLRCIFHALAETDLTLVESLYFISLSDDSKLIRRHLTDKIKNPVIREIWQSFQALRPREYNEQFSSSANRLIEFLSSDRIRRIIGQSKATISFKKMMDEGYIVLVNLSSGQRLSRDNARLLGTLMINDLFLSATERKRTRTTLPKPFYLYIDECAQFLNEDIGRILDECRKYGLHLVLAHQHLAQLREAGEKIYGSVMTDAKTKIVFGGLTPEDAEILAKQIFMGEFDIDEVKHRIYNCQVVGQHRKWFKSKSDTVGKSESEGETEADGTSEMTVESESVGSADMVGTSDGNANSWGAGIGESRGAGVMSGESSPVLSEDKVLSYNTSEFVGSIGSSSVGGGSSHTDSEAHTDSYSQGVSKGTTTSLIRAISKIKTDIESYTEGESEQMVSELAERLASIQFRPLEEQLHRAMAMMVNQPTAHCLVKVPLEKVKAIKVSRVEEDDAIFCPDMDLLAIYERENFQKHKDQFIALREQVDAEIDGRQAELLEDARKAQKAEKAEKEKAKETVEDYLE